MIRDLQKDQIYIVKAKVESDDFSGGVRLVAEAIEHLDRYREKVAKEIVIKVSTSEQVSDVLRSLPELVSSTPAGHCRISLAYQGSAAQATLQLGAQWSVKPRADLLKQLESHFGSDRFRVVF